MKKMIPKYRAWLVNAQRMINVQEINFYVKTISYIEDDYESLEQTWEDEDLNKVVLMQFTGLKDKNGVEVYEGDIVHWKDCESIDDEIVYENTFVIYWSDEFLIWRAKNKGNDIDLYDISDNRELEIIGNIYDNKELLTVRK